MNWCLSLRDPQTFYCCPYDLWPCYKLIERCGPLLYNTMTGCGLIVPTSTIELVIFKGSIFHDFALISNVKGVIFTNFCYGQYLCNTILKLFQGFIIHEYGLYLEI